MGFPVGREHLNLSQNQDSSHKNIFYLIDDNDNDYDNNVINDSNIYDDYNFNDKFLVLSILTFYDYWKSIRKKNTANKVDTQLQIKHI